MKRGSTSIDWQTYPILRFDAVPERVDVHIINRPGPPLLGQRRNRSGPRGRLNAMRSRMPPASVCATCR